MYNTNNTTNMPLAGKSGYCAQLKFSSLMQGLPDDLQQKLAAKGEAAEFRKNDALFLDGTAADHVFCVLDGKVKEYYTNNAGEECLRRIITRGHMVSLHHVFSGDTIYTYSCQALGLASCYFWKTETIRTMMQQEPELTMKVAQLLSGYMEESCRLHCICRKPQACARVAAYLLSKNNDKKEHGSGKRSRNMAIDISPLSLAARDICLARETFSRSLSRIQEMGYIRQNNGIIHLLNTDGLMELSGIQACTCGPEKEFF